MKVLIESLDNGSGVDDRFYVYKVYNTKQNLTDNRPYCLIESEDFFDLFNDPEKEFERACEGKIYFNVSLNSLDMAAKKIY